jgi:hypothetical protein
MPWYRTGAECGACALPFTFDGAAYHACAGAGAEAWCSLTPIFRGERGECPEDCLSAGVRAERCRTYVAHAIALATPSPLSTNSGPERHHPPSFSRHSKPLLRSDPVQSKLRVLSSVPL